MVLRKKTHKKRQESDAKDEDDQSRNKFVSLLIV